MAYLNAAERTENIVAGDHDPRPDAPHKKPVVSKTKICWILMVLAVAIPLAIFIGILQFFPSLMDISQGILNERKANKTANTETVAVSQPSWSYGGNAPSANLPRPIYPPQPPMYPPPPMAHDEYHPKPVFERPMEVDQNRGNVQPVDEYSARRAFANHYPERNPYDRYHQWPPENPAKRTFQDLGQDSFGLSAVAEDSEEDEAHRGRVRSSEKLSIDSPDARILLEKINPNWYSKVSAFKKKIQQPAA